MPIQIKRAYDEVNGGAEYRILVDRLWPRGISKEELRLDEWMKEIAPSDELRKWFDHDPEKFEAFKERYIAELKDRKEEVTQLIDHIHREDNITLIYAAKDREHNHARVLKEYLESQSF